MVLSIFYFKNKTRCTGVKPIDCIGVKPKAQTEKNPRLTGVKAKEIMLKMAQTLNQKGFERAL